MPRKDVLARREYDRKYSSTPEGKARINKSRATPERKTVFRNYKLKTLFNLEPGDWDLIRAFQARHPIFALLLNKPGAKYRESVEHRHADGFIRGVMAGMLNRAYGLIERLYPHNTGDVLRALAEFHDNPPAPEALGEPVYGLIGRAEHKKVMKYGPDGSSSPQPRRST